MTQRVVFGPEVTNFCAKLKISLSLLLLFRFTSLSLSSVFFLSFFFFFFLSNQEIESRQITKTVWNVKRSKKVATAAMDSRAEKSRASSAMDRQWFFSLPVWQGSSRAGEDNRQIYPFTLCSTRYSYTYTNAFSFSFSFFSFFGILFVDFIWIYLHTQAAGSHEHSMVRASGTRPERFLSPSS